VGDRGAQVYAETLGMADRLLVTEIDLVIDGDAFAPEIDAAAWGLTDDGPWAQGAGGVRYRFRTYTRSETSGG